MRTPPKLPLDVMLGIVETYIGERSSKNCRILEAAMLRPAIVIVNRYCRNNQQWDDTFQAAFLGILHGIKYLPDDVTEPSHVLNYIKAVIKRYVIDYLNRDNIIRIPRHKLGSLRLCVLSLSGEESTTDDSIVYDLELTHGEYAIVERLLIGTPGREICRELNLRRRVYESLLVKLRSQLR